MDDVRNKFHVFFHKLFAVFILYEYECCMAKQIISGVYWSNEAPDSKLLLILSWISSKKYSKFILTHTFLVIVTGVLGHGVYRKLYT